MTIRAIVALVLASLALAAFANEAKIKKTVEDNFGVKVEGIQPGPMGLFEVRFKTPAGMRVVYTDANATHIIVGKLYESQSGEDITEKRLRKLNAIKFEALPLDQAVKIQRGNGKRVLAMFSDPHCPACKQFEQTLQQIDDITVYVFMVPIIRPEFAEHSKAVWCAPDRAKAWLDVALRGKAPAGKANCATPVDKNIELGRTLGVNATPTLIFADGERVSGGLRLADLTESLDKSKK